MDWCCTVWVFALILVFSVECVGCSFGCVFDLDYMFGCLGIVCFVYLLMVTWVAFCWLHVCRL